METHELTQRFAEDLATAPGQPVAHAIVEHIWLAVVQGRLSTGERLPTARQIAIALNVSPRAVERAYDQLEQRGVIATRRGEGTFVSLELPSEAERVRHRDFAELCRETMARSRELGFDLDELLDALADYRGVDPTP